jgi:predicted transcriptional regulator of viral defense system
VSQVADRPSWDALFNVALTQDGLFTTQQAAESGYSRPLLARYLQSGKVERVMHGIYRLVHYPCSESEQLTMLWLWSGREGVFSHETALFLFDLSDALPSRIHLTLPNSWRRRRLRVPEVLRLHHADLPAADRTWVGAVQVTTPRRTLLDCNSDHVAPDLVEQAIEQALARGMVTPKELSAIALHP